MTKNGIDDKISNHRNKTNKKKIRRMDGQIQRSVANARRRDEERKAVGARGSEQHSHSGGAADRNGHANKRSLITLDAPVRQIVSCFLTQKYVIISNEMCFKECYELACRPKLPGDRYYAN